MRVLQLTTTRRPFFDQQVEALRARGVDCEVATVPGTHGDGETRSPVDYLRYYPDVLRRSVDDFDVVHANWGLVGPFALAQPTRPVVLTLWGSDLMGASWLRYVSATSARFADAVVLPSRVMAPYLGASYTYVPFGVDVDTFRPIPRSEARDRVGWDADGRVALFPYDPDRSEKDYDRAKRVVERADADVELRVLTGADYEEMPYYYGASDLLLVTSKHESGPMAVKEAAACNVPVVSTDVGFVRETLDGVANSAVATTDAELAAAVTDVVRRGERSDGRDAVDTLSVDDVGEKLVGLYERVLAERGRGARR